MSRKYKIRDQDKFYFVTFTVVQWLDVFIRQEYRDIFLDSIRYCQQNKGLDVCAYVPIAIGMSSHVHMLVGRHGNESLDGIIRDIKKFTSRKIIEVIKENPHESRRELLLWLFERAGQHNNNNTRYHPDSYRDWQQNNQPIELTTDEKVDKIVDYTGLPVGRFMKIQ